MPERHPPKLKQHVLAIALLILALAVTWFAYAPGISGGLHFDDTPNLGGLANVEDWESALRFIVSGHAGPLGRPLALASFLPQADAWPDKPEVFLQTNILIHLLNGLLVSWFLYLLGRARGAADRQAAYAAVAGAAIWMLMPILASSSLFIVQRMTTLSATFVLLGAIGYLRARAGTQRKPLLALSLMTIALGLGALLGALSKESGVLLLLYVLAMETTLLRRPEGVKPTVWRGWFAAVLVLPAALLLAYLASRLPYSEGLVLRRGFTGFERLITEAEVLWKYLYLAFFPSPSHLGPYHDDYRVLQSLATPAAAISVGAWILAIVAVILLRRRAPLFSFAVAWFLGGHLIESTTVSLELYYEHRNYLPLVGPVYALVAASLSVARQWRTVAAGLLGVYCALLAAILFSVTSLSGNPALATEMWSIYNPDSLRATQRLASKNEADRDPHTALRMLRNFLDRNPDETTVKVSILAISCQVEPEANHRQMAADLVMRLKAMPYSHSTFRGVSGLYELIQSGRCEELSNEDIYKMAQSLLENPRYRLSLVRHNLHVLMARIAMERGDLPLTMHHMESALARHADINTLGLAVGILNSAGLEDVSRELLKESPKWRPTHPIRAALWDRQIDTLMRVSQNDNKD